MKFSPFLSFETKMNFQKKDCFLILSLIFFGLFSNNICFAQEGLVPCTAQECTLCHLFVLIDNIVDFLFKFILWPLATLLLVTGGLMLYFSADNPGMIEKAKDLMKSVAIGLGIILSAFLIISLVFNAIGLSDWAKPIYQGLLEGNFIEIQCETPATP